MSIFDFFEVITNFLLLIYRDKDSNYQIKKILIYFLEVKFE